MTYLDPAKHPRMATAFAISNMGHSVPEGIHENIGSRETVQGQVCNWAGHLMETDEHEEIFVMEAESWLDLFKNKDQEYILSVHGAHCPWIQRIIDAPVEAR